MPYIPKKDLVFIEKRLKGDQVDWYLLLQILWTSSDLMMALKNIVLKYSKTRPKNQKKDAPCRGLITIYGT